MFVSISSNLFKVSLFFLPGLILNIRILLKPFYFGISSLSYTTANLIIYLSNIHLMSIFLSMEKEDMFLENKNNLCSIISFSFLSALK